MLRCRNGCTTQRVEGGDDLGRVLHALRCRVGEESYQVVAMARTGAGDELPAEAGEDAARGLAVVAHVVEIVRDGFARGEAFMPGAQCGERRKVGECGGQRGGQGSGRSGGWSVP